MTTPPPDCVHRALCRIGPVAFTVEDRKGPILLEPELGLFRVSPDRGRESSYPGSKAGLVLSVERGAPSARPRSALAATHRTGWDIYRQNDEMTAIKAIPYGGDRVLRSVIMRLDGGKALLRISPEDNQADFPFAYTLSELLVLLLSRVSGAILIHGACVEVNGKATLFAGPSGSGKSTMARLWHEAGRGTVLGDESHLLWPGAHDGFYVSGTPWPGSSGLFANRIAPLERAFFLEHGPKNATRAISPADAAVRLMSHAFLPAWDARSMEAVTDLAARLAARIPSARLAFVPDETVVDFLL